MNYPPWLNTTIPRYTEAFNMAFPFPWHNMKKRLLQLSLAGCQQSLRFCKITIKKPCPLNPCCWGFNLVSFWFLQNMSSFGYQSLMCLQKYFQKTYISPINHIIGKIFKYFTIGGGQNLNTKNIKLLTNITKLLKTKMFNSKQQIWNNRISIYINNAAKIKNWMIL